MAGWQVFGGWLMFVHGVENVPHAYPPNNAEFRRPQDAEVRR
jgi:hypothetical protein